MLVIDGVEMVDVHEAAGLSGRTAETVRRWAWSGRLSAVKRGNKLFVPRSEVPVDLGVRSLAVRPGLREWAARLAEIPTGQPGSTAADLLGEDRAARARP